MNSSFGSRKNFLQKKLAPNPNRQAIFLGGNSPDTIAFILSAHSHINSIYRNNNSISGIIKSKFKIINATYENILSR